jgi:hypothetical protein
MKIEKRERKRGKESYKESKGRKERKSSKDKRKEKEGEKRRKR